MIDSFKNFGQNTFSSLWIRNYRLYFIGQGLSQGGNWMQIVGLGWLVLQLTGSGTALGTVLAFRFAPMLFGGPFAGIIVDRFEKRSILYITQSAFALIALALSILIYTDAVRIWMLFGFAFLQGLFDVVDNPSRQTFVHEMVGRDNLRNAVALNSTEANLARALGPLVAGSLIAGVGIAFCFLANAVSFGAVIFVLWLMRESEFRKEHHERKPQGHVLESLSYVVSTPLIKSVLIVMAAIGTFSYEFQVTLPLLAQETFHGVAADYAALLSAMGAGSVAGGLFAASRQKIVPREFVISALLFGISICVTAIMPTLSLAVIGMIFVGFFSINLTSLGNTMIQLESTPHMRGRVMSLWSMAIFGSTLIGGPTVGFIGEFVNARSALAIGGVVAILAAGYAARNMLKRDQLPRTAEVELENDKAAAENVKL